MTAKKREGREGREGRERSEGSNEYPERFQIEIGEHSPILQTRFEGIRGSSSSELRAYLSKQNWEGRMRESRFIAMYAIDIDVALVRDLAAYRPDVVASHPLVEGALLREALRSRFEQSACIRTNGIATLRWAAARDALLVGLRREVLEVDSSLADELEDYARKMGRHKDEARGVDEAVAECLLWAGRIRLACVAKESQEERREVLSEAYRADDRAREEWDDAGRGAVVHPYRTVEEVLEIWSKYPSNGVADALAGRATRSKRFFEHPEIRRRLREYLHLQSVARALALSPVPEDFSAAMERLWDSDAERDRLLLDGRIVSEALGWLSRSQQSEILAGSNADLRLKVIRGISASPVLQGKEGRVARFSR